MEKIKIKKANGHIIPCLVEVPENPKGIIIMVHGFTSSKSCATAEMLFRRMIPEGIGVVAYDQPAHGNEEAREEPLRTEGCMDSLEAVENYVAEKYPKTDIFYFSSSYGAYITGLYINSRKHRGKKAFFRSAAVIMPELILKPFYEEMDEKSREEFRKIGYVDTNLGLGDMVRLPSGFIDDMEQNDLFETFRRAKADNGDGHGSFGNTAIEMVHGEEDPEIPIEAAKAFAEEFKIKINIMKKEGHSICNDPKSPDRVADLAIDFYNC